MELFLNKKANRFRLMKLFGIPIYETDNQNGFKYQRFLGNFISVEKTKTPTEDIKTSKILNIQISKSILEADIVKHYFLGYLVRKISLSNIFYNKYLKKIDKEFDDVYVLDSNSGEIFLFFAYLINSVLKKNDSQKPLFVGLKKYHIDILKLFLPKANCIIADSSDFKIRSDAWFSNGHKFYLIFSRRHFQEIEKSIKEDKHNSIHYFNSMMKQLGLTEKDCSKPTVMIPELVKESLNQKIETLNLDIDNFVIIAPEALTCKELSISFWKNLVKELKHRNFDIFLNAMTNKYNFNDVKSIYLDYQEAYYLAQKAKAVISLRSGFSEFLLPTEIPNLAIYTQFRNRTKNAFSTEKGISSFTMTKIPFINREKIKEFNADNYINEDELLKYVLEIFDKYQLNTKEECLA